MKPPTYVPLIDMEKRSNEPVVDAQDLQHDVPTTVSENNICEPRWQRTIELIGDVVFCLAPLQFVALAISARFLDGKTTDIPLGNTVAQWARVSGTLFPIVFAGVVGRSLRLIARYKLEKGTRLQVLEQLFGSQSVFSSFWTQYTLLRFNLLGLALVLLWLMSPVGGQTASRILYRTWDAYSRDQKLATIDLYNQTTLFYGIRSDYSPQFLWHAANSLFEASFMNTYDGRTLSQDLWGNVKIPSYKSESEQEAGYTGDSQDWISLIGQPVAGITLGWHGDTDRYDSFYLQSFYYNVSCSQPYSMPAQSDWVTTLNITVDANTGERYNETSIWQDSVTFRVDPTVVGEFHYDGDHQTENRTFTWLSKANAAYSLENSYDPATDSIYDYTNVTVAQCMITPQHVKTRVSCNNDTCNPDTSELIRRPQNLNSSDITQARYWAGDLIVDDFAWNRFWENLSKRQSLGSESGFPTSTFVENFISGTTRNLFTPPDGYVDLSKVSSQDFAKRLQLVINTYYLAFLSPTVSTGQLSPTLLDGRSNNDVDPQALLNGTVSFFDGEFNVSFTDTTTQTTDYSRVWGCDPIFLTVTIAISLFITALGLYGTYLKYRCQGPEMLGYVASLVRDNPNTPLGQYNSNVHTSVLVRRHRDMYLRLEDVMEDHSVGHVAISSLQKRSIKVANREDPSRRYVHH